MQQTWTFRPWEGQEGARRPVGNEEDCQAESKGALTAPEDIGQRQEINTSMASASIPPVESGARDASLLDLDMMSNSI
jgi:hypothetical protein